jgi:hypothetical protein
MLEPRPEIRIPIFMKGLATESTESTEIFF